MERGAPRRTALVPTKCGASAAELRAPTWGTTARGLQIESSVESISALLENVLDITGPDMTNTLVIQTKEFSMKLTLLRRFAYLGLAAVLYAPIGLLLLSRAATILV